MRAFNIKKDIWHFSRADLPKQVMSLFNSGLSSALTFLAPRRMGKTEFLLKDIYPTAQKEGWQVFYHSFLGNDSNRQKEFIRALNPFGIDSGAIKKKSKLSQVTGATAGIKCEVEFDTQSENLADLGLVQLIKNLSKKHKTLLLLDEIQALALSQKNDDFLANLRTALDTNKDRVKVIFTGSSREKLQQMFSSAQAPFFHLLWRGSVL